MLLADSHITMVVGVDVHVTTAPPFNPIHPYIGMVIDPADYIPFLGTNVSVNGLKRGVSDTGGIIIPLMHIPLAGPFAMASIIGHESTNFFASQTVFCDGVRMSPKGYMVMTCNDVGIPLSASIGKGKAGKVPMTTTVRIRATWRKSTDRFSGEHAPTRIMIKPCRSSPRICWQYS